MIHLDKVKMNVVKTADKGVVGKGTIFRFRQNKHSVWARYAGGKIENGFLVGQIKGTLLEFSYCQLQIDGEMDNGTSTAELTRSDSGKIRLIEHFQWTSRPGEFGTNIFEQM